MLQMTAEMNSDSGNKPSSPSADSVSKDKLSKATSELNNLLQIISGTSAEIENLWEGSDASEKYLAVLRASIERAEAVAGQLAEHAGCTEQKMLMHPELASFIKPKSVSRMPISKPSILVVDDEEVALTLIKSLLSGAGYRVLTAQSGFECLDLFRRQPQGYELILLDLTMPFMDGEETFHRLREIRPDVPILLCTGFIQQGRLERLMTAGLSGFLRKPFAPDEIAGQVKSILESVKYSRANGTQSGDGTSLAS